MTSPVLKSGSQLSCSFEVDVSRLRFELVAVDPVIMPADTKGNVLRGALMDIVNWLALTKVVQLLEFAKHLQPAGRHGRESVVDAIQRTRGKYKDALSSSKKFAAQKSDERFLENRCCRE